MSITLTKDQEAALKLFQDFLVMPNEKYMIIQGAAGCGKSTLVEYLVKSLDAQMKMYALLLRKNKHQGQFEVCLTATTNKAVAVLSELTQMDTQTIHSLLHLTVQANYDTGAIKLTKKRDYCLLFNKLIFIDEASMINDELFKIIDETTHACKIVLIGDKYQLAPVRQRVPVMETVDCPQVTMNKVMRHNGPILLTGAQFRETVETGIWKNVPDLPPELIRVDGPTFQNLIDKAFTDKDYAVDTAKVLAWTNQKVINYNTYIRTLRGYPDVLQPGETVFTNNPIMLGSRMIPTDSRLIIQSVGPIIESHGVKGRMIGIARDTEAFLPESQYEAKQYFKILAKAKQWQLLYGLKDSWLDLRPAYASTVHKSQGSTYGTVFINLSDIGRCHIQSDVARMMYVSISRAAKQVYFYGDLPTKYKEIAV